MKKTVLAALLLWPFLAVTAQIPFSTNEYPGYFSSAFACNGNDIFVGGAAPNLTSKVFFFVKDGTDISQEQIILDPEPANNTYFGNGLSVSGDFLAVSATAHNETNGYGSGKLYLFSKAAGTYQWVQTLSAPDEISGNAFGTPYFLGGQLFVSAVRDDSGSEPELQDSGSVYVYDFDGSEWTFSQKITVPETWMFGSEIRLDSDRLVISSTATEAKFLHTFVKSGNDWIFDTTTTLQDGFNEYRGYDLSDGKLYILKDHLDYFEPSYLCKVVELDYGATGWVENSMFGFVPNSDEYYSRIEIEGNKMFIGSIAGYVLQMGRNWPIHYLHNDGSGWQYIDSFYSEAPGNGDDYFAALFATDAHGLVARGESGLMGPYGKSYFIDFADLGTTEFKKADVVIYPNPSASLLNMQHTSNAQIGKVRVISLSGQVLMERSDIGQMVDVSALASGMYLVEMHFSDGSIVVKRFIRS